MGKVYKIVTKYKDVYGLWSTNTRPEEIRQDAPFAVQYGEGTVSIPCLGCDPLFAFDTEHHAYALLDNSVKQLWECEAVIVRRPKRLPRWAVERGVWYEGTVLCSQIKLVRRIK